MPQYVMQELNWRGVPDFPNYEVSDSGIVRVKASSKPTQVGTFLKASPNKQGYLVYKLYSKRSIKMALAHRLVAEAFIPNTGNKPEVNHKTGDKRNCRADNLEWVTSVENAQHALSTGLSSNFRRGPRVPDETRERMCELASAGRTAVSIAKEFGVHHTTVLKFIRSRR